MTTYFAAAAASWGVVMAFAPLLQIRTILAHRSSRGVSTAYQHVLLFGFALWIAYGVSADNLALIVPNSVAAVVSVATILVVRRFREVAV